MTNHERILRAENLVTYAEQILDRHGVEKCRVFLRLLLDKAWGILSGGNNDA